MNDVEIVSAQLGRSLICDMTTVVRCASGYPVVIKNAPATANGLPFPTLYWLTCPELRARISKLETTGAVAELGAFVKADAPTRAALRVSDRRYRLVRDGGHKAKTGSVGIAGSRDPLNLKCLHAHAADYLAQGLNPVGRLVMERAPLPEDCAACASLCG